jgi:lipopolysaccharide biosynthesis regulator YciM
MVDALRQLDPMTLNALLGGLCLALGLVGGVLWMRRRAGQRERTLNEALLGALERALRGEAKEAFDLLSREAARADASPALYFALAAALRRLEMNERSAMIHRGLLARSGLKRAERIRAQLGLAADYLHLGRASLAESLLRELPRSVRRHPSLLAVRKQAALQAGDWKEAIESTSLLLRAKHGKSSELAEIYARMGQEALESADERGAAKSFRRALRQDAENLRARYGLAELLLRQNKGTQARKQFLAMLSHHPALVPVLLPRIRASLDLNQARERERYVKLLENLGSVEQAAVWVGLEQAEILFAAGKLEPTRELLERLEREHPQVFEVRESLINFLIETHADEDLLKYCSTLLAFASRGIQRFRCRSCGYTAATSFLDCPVCHRFAQLEYQTVLSKAHEHTPIAVSSAPEPFQAEQ